MTRHYSTWKKIRKVITTPSFRDMFFKDHVLIHINKTGGSSVEKALGLAFQHRTAEEIRAIIGPARWERKFSFTFVRNPWSRVVSQYHYRVGINHADLQTEPLDFAQWVQRAYVEQEPRYYDKPRMFRTQMEWIADEDGTVMVDWIGCFERLHEDFRTLAARLGKQAELPHLKKSKHRDYREHYDEETRRIISECYAPDIETFGYRFSQNHRFPE